MEIVENIKEACGLYFRSVFLPERGSSVAQHIHDHDHANLCAAGSASYFEDGRYVQDVKAGDVIEVKAGRLHSFVATEDNTRLVCVHDIASAMAIKERGV